MEQDLIDYGLSEKEAKLYLLCLKTGETTANRLIELTGFPRGTTYDVLEKLKLRGLITSIIKEKTTYFSANDPKVLVKALDEKKTNIEKVLPRLKNLSNTIEKEITIEIFEGIVGIKKILDDILDNCKEVIIMGNEEIATEMMQHYPENFKLKRINKRIKIKNLVDESLIARKLKNDKYSEVKHTDKLKDSKELLIIYKDITAHIIMQEPITSIKITSKEYTKTQRGLFECFWKLAKL